jgi:tRNA G37 N-methylase Trm5
VDKMTPYEKLVFSINNYLLSKKYRSQDIERLLEEIPKRWEKFDDVVLLPRSSFIDKEWMLNGNDIWEIIAYSLDVKRVGRSGEIIGEKRESTVEMLVGEKDWVIRKENGIKYGYHLTECMFSSGNINERKRMGEVVAKGEVVVDLFCGIGYYTLPILVNSDAKHVYSCEWNDNAINALKFNLKNNNVEKKCSVFEGDNRITTKELRGIADRVLLGLLPSAEKFYHTALNCLKKNGGVLHLHGLSPSDNHEELVIKSKKILEKINKKYEVGNITINKIKSYAPHWDHLVLDIEIIGK